MKPISRCSATAIALAAAVVISAAPACAQGLKGMWGPAIERGVSQFPVYQDLGVQLYETSLSWAAVATRRPAHPRSPSDPAYTWPQSLSADVAQSATSGIRVAIQVTGAPGWANGGKASNWAPRNPADFADFVYAASRRYPTVHVWMVWGEPTRRVAYQPLVRVNPTATSLSAVQKVAPHRYARMLDAAYVALKRASSRNAVVGGMTYTTGDIRTRQWIENLRLPSGRAPRMDLYGHNPFSFRDPNLAAAPSAAGAVDFSDLRRLAGWIDRYLGRGRPQIKLFLSEWTIPTAVDSEFNFYVDPGVQAQWITDGLRIARSWPRIYALGWINLYDNLPRSAGGLLDGNGNKKPGYYAWQSG